MSEEVIKNDKVINTIENTAKNIWARKSSSGKWILTVMAGVALFIMTLTNCMVALRNGETLPFSNEALFSLVTMVFVSYFNRKTEENS